ncbi:MAG: leucyl aminopeptidase, partial [Epsilonproteobacteria bacterium]|nr:leucyl aminopeptidase [Campylobacterota bacterium]NPA89371.1 leucyl aminopeptidase [Campylobacterota bacterium]
TAALFLEHFINERNRNRWLHLDIAGPAYTEKGWGPHPYGGTGFGVSTLVDYIQNYISY